jgi:carbon monoxide dehydrogenase subunit G
MKPQLFASVTITKEKKAIQTHGKGGVQRFIHSSVPVKIPANIMGTRTSRSISKHQAARKSGPENL